MVFWGFAKSFFKATQGNFWKFKLNYLGLKESFIKSFK
jgi:hypothetical protein